MSADEECFGGFTGSWRIISDRNHSEVTAVTHTVETGPLCYSHLLTHTNTLIHIITNSNYWSSASASALPAHAASGSAQSRPLCWRLRLSDFYCPPPRLTQNTVLPSLPLFHLFVVLFLHSPTSEGFSLKRRWRRLDSHLCTLWAERTERIWTQTICRMTKNLTVVGVWSLKVSLTNYVINDTVDRQSVATTDL